MNQRNKIYLFLFVLGLGLLTIYELQKPKPINWFETYVSSHKMPFGTYVLFKELADLFPKSKIETIRISPYLFLKDSSKAGTYMFIDKSVNFGKAEFDELLKFVEKGNTVFIATHQINIDTLHLKTKLLQSNALEEKPYFTLSNKAFGSKEYYFDRPFENFVFKEVDTIAANILGESGLLNTQNSRIKSGVNFVKYQYGKGYFLFNTYPEAFINYTLLKAPNQEYAAQVLSYLGNPSYIYWDAYYKSGKTQISSPLYFILSNKSLKWAYQIVLFGSLVFVLFGGKRIQRIIPIIKPLQNQTLAFTRTISNMYYTKASHKIIATHKIRYFLAEIRLKYHIETDIYKKDFTKIAALKIGKSFEETEKVINFIKLVEAKQNLTKADLILLNNLIYNLTH
ncbi:MAG: DUF4350 domain-containing protein [Flavobacteriales bacterium CG_4_8_14_3_um_filter_35_10]|nr:MAG: DUF4350 domain-containing protein [Flavobacteriales bacterium CG_4_8_14_3_um_filter_35_10]